MRDLPKYHYVIREGSAMLGKYNPQKEYQLFWLYVSRMILSLQREFGIDPLYLLFREDCI